MSCVDSQPHTSCRADGCESYVLDHRWARIRAHANGWYFERNGDVYCPTHKPERVEQWRNRKKEP